MNTLFVLSNSPGEIAGWMGPVAKAAAERGGIELKAVTLPCPYASGREAQCALVFPCVTEALSFREAIAEKRREGEKISVLQLGGDPFFGYALSKKLRAPWTIYTSRPRWRRSVTRYFIPDEAAEKRFRKAGVPETQWLKTGNLMLDSVPRVTEEQKKAFLSEWGLEKGPVIAFMAGSRPFEYETAFPFFVQTALLLRESFPEWQAVLPVAPTVEQGRLEVSLESAGFRLEKENKALCVKAGSHGIPLLREGQYEALAAASLIVALPGTNNLQAAALGTPLLMAAPLNKAEEIPLDGLAGDIPLSWPGMRRAKKQLVHWYNGREKYLSLPNRLTGERLVPERRELMTPESLCLYVGEYLKAPELREKIAEGYSRLDLTKGAAAKIVAALENCFR